MEQELREQVLEGYRRLAFGSVKDAVRLLFCDELSARALNGMDLFSVSEIKRPKGGGMEIKFFDRLRALQCLQTLEGSGEELCGFYRALEEGAKALSPEE